MIQHTDDPLIFNTQVNRVKYARAPKNEQQCPFCDVKNLTNILKMEEDRIWLLNKFSTIENSQMTVIIESSEHLGDISTYSLKENRKIFRFAFNCWQEMIANPKFESVLMFKNFGPRSGGTLRHPHLQVVGLEKTDGYEHISKENFEGLEVLSNDKIRVTLSTRPVMGFVEYNVLMKEERFIDELADAMSKLTHWLLTEYMDGRCDSYNLFFYHFEGKTICKMVPRFITSPYYIGYKLPQVNKRDYLEEVAEELRKLL